jgi:intergrase/recombinase
MFYKIKGISPKTGKGKVSVIYRQPGFEALKSTGVTVAPADFDQKTGKVKSRVPEHLELNWKIQRVEAYLGFAIRDVLEAGGQLTKELLDERYNFYVENSGALHKSVEEMVARYPGEVIERRAKLDEEAEKLEAKERELGEDVTYWAALGAKIPGATTVTLTAKIADFIKANPEHRRKNTVEGYKDLYDRLMGFRPATKLEEVNLKYLQDFQSFLVGQGKRNKTVRAYLERFKKLYTYLADEAELPTGFLKKLVMVEELQNDDVIFLTDEEVAAIEAVQGLTERQTYVRAQFLFGCETALRHSDLYITPANIRETELYIPSRKGKKSVKPPLTNKAKAILNSEHYPFRKLPASQYNAAIQAVCRKIPAFHQVVAQTHFVGNEPVTVEKEKWELVTSHVARKTAINKWLALGVRESVVALWAGHKNTRMLQKHYQNNEAASAQERQKLPEYIGK